MTSAALQRLGQELGGNAPAALAALSEQELTVLADAVARLKTRQQQDLGKALEAALGHVPALLRGAVRKILFA